MIKVFKLSLVMAGLSIFALHGMEDKAKKNHHDRTSKITPETILGMLAPLSTEQNEIVRSWTDENAWTLKQLVEMPSFNDFPTQYAENVKKLASIGVKNVGTCNYDFQIPGSQVIAKISGMATRRQNIIAGQGKMAESDGLINSYCTSAEGSPRTEALEKIKKFRTERFEEYQANPVNTMQSITRAAYNLLLQETQKQENLNSLYIPQVNLVPFAGQHEAAVCDENYYPVEEYLEDLKPLTKEVLRDLSPDTIVQILKAVKGAYLWSLGNNIGIRSDEKTVVLHDLEQPDCMSPQNFILKNKERAEVDAAIGLREVLDLIKDNENQLEAAREFILNDEEIKNFGWYENHIKPGLKLQ